MNDSNQPQRPAKTFCAGLAAGVPVAYAPSPNRTDSGLARHTRIRTPAKLCIHIRSLSFLLMLQSAVLSILLLHLTLRLSTIASIVGNRRHHVVEVIGRRLSILPTRPTSARKVGFCEQTRALPNDVGVSIDWHSTLSPQPTRR